MLKYELFDYQKETLEFALSNQYCIIALQMGLGKTAIAIAIKDSFPKARCLIVCPSYLTLMWENEINKFLDGQVITRFKKKADVFYPADTDFVIVSYDIAIASPTLFEWANMVVIDEATALKTMTSKRTEKIHQYIYEQSIPRVYLLTGTPILNRVGEFYSLIALCNYSPKIKESKFLKQFPNNIEFNDRYSHRREFEMIRGNRRIKILNWEGIQREEELKKWLEGIYIRKKNTSREINYQKIYLDDFDDKDLAEAFDGYEGMSSVAPNVKAEAALRTVPLTVKYIRGLVEAGEVEGPIIIYTDHRESCRALAKAFDTEAITGEMPVSKRQMLADKFQKGGMAYLTATIGSFSTGITLTKSNFIVINDLPWVPGMLEQAAFRINRTGQERQCHVHWMLGSKQAEYILNTLLEKAEVLNKVY